MHKFGWVNWSKLVEKSLEEKVEDIEELESERKAAEISGISPEDKREVKESLAKEVVKSCEETDKSKKGMSVKEFDKWCEEL